jgi:glycosyltransferase involved in cell wall biosynthesis
MKILEAWARGVPIVATPEAAAGLGAQDGRELLIAATPDDFAAAIDRLASQPELPRALVAAGRRLLLERHDPVRAAEALRRIYETARHSAGFTGPRAADWRPTAALP